MTTVNVDQAQEEFPALLSSLEKGESIVLERDGKPIGQITLVAQPSAEGKRQFGWMAGQFTVPEDFNEMMRDETEEMFYGKP